MQKKDIIKKLFFECNYKQIEIAKELDVSTKYISKVLISDDRYKVEKDKRKELSNKRHVEKTKQYINEKRKTAKIDREYEYMKYQHNQDVFELSGSNNKINNLNFRKWNSSAYKYNSKTKSFHLVRGLNVSQDVPKIIR